ncbi:MAG: SpoIIE family protein phosphatase [Thermoguttaceae bacterium]|nr:SpoIIE family protein phosphatase [Thermoguttaceae bacterium]
MPSFLKTASADLRNQVRYPIDKEMVDIGRHHQCDIRLTDDAVSRLHARIQFDRGQYTIEDKNSSNGTFVNGRRISRAVVLHDGDRVRIGSREFLFESDAAGARRPPASPVYSVGSVILDESLSKDSISFTSQVDLRNVAQQPLIRQPQADIAAELKNLRTKFDVTMSMMKNLGKVTDRRGLLPEFFVNLLRLFPQADVVSALGPDGGSSRLKLLDWRVRGGGSEKPVRISRSIPQYVFDNEKAIISDSPASDPRFNAGEDSVLKKDVYSAMAVPIFKYEEEKKSPLAVVLVESRTGETKFSDSDLDLLIAIANQIGLYSENLKYQDLRHQEEMLEKELELAKQVQTALLPSEPPKYSCYTFFDYYRPAKTIGGDFYDFIRLPEGRLAVVLADVSGKGIPAALLAAKLSSDVRTALTSEKTPVDALKRLGYTFKTRRLEGRFITMIVLVLEPGNGRLHLFNAGHDTPFLRRADGSVEQVGYGKHGAPIAVDPEQECEEVVVDLMPGDAFVMMTDGIPDAADSDGARFTTKRTRLFLENLKSSSSADIGEGLIAEVRRFVGSAPQADDQCVIVVGRNAEQRGGTISRNGTA